jgi:hypothetical protein
MRHDATCQRMTLKSLMTQEASGLYIRWPSHNLRAILQMKLSRGSPCPPPRARRPPGTSSLCAKELKGSTGPHSTYAGLLIPGFGLPPPFPIRGKAILEFPIIF